MFAGLPYQSPQLNMLKRFQNDRAFNARNGTETLLCNVTVVLNIAAFLRYCVIPGEGFRIKNKAYFTWEMAEEFARCSAGIVDLFFVVFFFFVQFPACNFPYGS